MILKKLDTHFLYPIEKKKNNIIPIVACSKYISESYIILSFYHSSEVASESMSMYINR